MSISYPHRDVHPFTVKMLRSYNLLFKLKFACYLRLITMKLHSILLLVLYCLTDPGRKSPLHQFLTDMLIISKSFTSHVHEFFGRALQNSSNASTWSWEQRMTSLQFWIAGLKLFQWLTFFNRGAIGWWTMMLMQPLE